MLCGKACLRHREGLRGLRAGALQGAAWWRRVPRGKGVVQRCGTGEAARGDGIGESV